MNRGRYASLVCLAIVALCVRPGGVARAETVSLDKAPHIHGLTVNPARPEQLILATHSGLFLASPDGTAVRIGPSRDDLMSFTVDPKDPATFYASGHPPSGEGNLGVLTSRDRGASWQTLADGVDGPVDFHAMTASSADTSVIYGMFKGLQVSRDGGKTWRRGGALPDDTFDLAAPADNPDRLFAAARGGLFVSDDGGAEWTTIQPQPTTMVHVTEAGRIYAFIYGLGLVTSTYARMGWEKLSGRFGDRYLLHMAVDPTNPEILHVVADTSAILTSRDGGRTWVSYQDHVRATPDLVAVGGRLFDQLCQSCHGAKGVGERPEDMHTTDEYGFVAPPLDNSSHGWHHSDDGLVHTILNGSSRNPRMMPFKEIITETDARNLVAYVKSLWNFSSLACQGARHMRCMH